MNVVVLTETGQGRFQQEIIAGEHRFIADEPAEVGGLGSGPGPYDLLLAALGACTAMTLRLYAERKALPLDRVTVRLSHSKIYATVPTAPSMRNCMRHRLGADMAAGARAIVHHRLLAELARHGGGYCAPPDE
jgi:hypothetical protein